MTDEQLRQDSLSCMEATLTESCTMQTFSDRTLLFKVQGGQVHSFSGIEKSLIDRLVSYVYVPELYALIESLFEVEKSDFRRDIDDFLLNLRSEGFVHIRRTEVPTVSIVVPALDAAHTLSACLTSLTHMSQPPGGFEVIVVDNGSMDCTLRLALQFPVTVIHEPKRGRSIARNVGVRAARGDFVAFVDADCIVDRDWVIRLAEAIAPAHVGGVQGCINVRRDEKVTPSSIESKIEAKMSFVRHLPLLATGGCMFRKSVFDQLGGFDEALNSYEDIDLSWRVLASGYSLVLIDDVGVHTDGWLTWSKATRRSIEAARAQSHFLSKWVAGFDVRPMRAVIRLLSAIDRRIRESVSAGSWDQCQAKLRGAWTDLVLIFGYVVAAPAIYRAYSSSPTEMAVIRQEPAGLKFRTTQYHLSPQLRYAFEPQLAYVVDMYAHRCLTLNETAALVLRSLLEGAHDTVGIVKAIASATDGASHEEISADVELFLGQLVEGRVLVAD